MQQARTHLGEQNARHRSDGAQEGKRQARRDGMVEEQEAQLDIALRRDPAQQKRVLQRLLHPRHPSEAQDGEEEVVLELQHAERRARRAVGHVFVPRNERQRVNVCTRPQAA